MFAIKNQQKHLSYGMTKRMLAIRALSAQAQSQPLTQHKPSAAEELEYLNAKPFSEIPGPSLLGLFRAFLPGGELYDLKIADINSVLSKKYGDLVKLPGGFGKRTILMSYNPANFEKIFRTEGVWPIRRGIDTFEHYRKHIRPEVFKGRGGLVSDQGEEWGKMRMAVNPVMMQPKVARAYIKPVDSVAREFIEQIRQMRDVNNEMPDDFGNRLNEWSLESIGVIALDHRLGVMSKERNEEAESIIKAVKDIFLLSFKLEMEPSIWRYYKTAPFKQLVAAFDVLTNLVMKYVEAGVKRHEQRQLAEAIDANKEQSVLDKLLKINPDYAVLMAFDMLFAGIDTTSAASANFLYHMAKFQDVQEKLRDEIKSHLPTVDTPLTTKVVDHMPYFKACLKESMRMSPIVPGNFRATGRNIVLDGYKVPADIDVAMGAILIFQDDSYFPRAREFLPERWLRDESAELKNQNLSPFVYLPFGFGPRTCIGKRFAELEIQILIMRILREFKVEWNYGPLEYGRAFVISPISKLKFKLTNVE